MKIKLSIFTIIACLLFASSSCTKNQSTDFEAKINVKGIISEKIYITVFGDKEDVNLVYNTPEKPVVSAQNGIFTIKGTLTEPAVIRVSFSDDKQLYKMAGRGYFPVKCMNLWFIATPGKNLNIIGDLTGKDFVALYPSQDKENKILAELNGKMMPLINDGGNISVKLATDTTLAEQQKVELKQQSDELDKKVAAIRENFIKEHPSSIAALWLMEDMLIRKQIEVSALEPILEKVDAKYHTNYFYISVKNRVEGAKNAAVGAQCPPVKGTDQSGNEFDITSLRGKYIIIDFWGTWCGACLAGMPDMKAFRDKHSDKVQIVGVAKDTDIEAWKKCIEKNQMDWPNILIGTGEADYASKFNVQGYPTKILVDPDGKIIYRTSGESKEFYNIAKSLITKQ
ncbi:MAG: TlpA family protein disulfide reductase [Bacteroidales bacterium]|nr:TlpA family protein disulfide reductase [Bacteroidales bacterium]